MIDLDITFFIQLVNFLVTLLVLNLVLFRPIRQVIAKRRALMAEQVADIDIFSTDAAAKLADYEKTLAEARKAGTAVRDELKEEGVAKEQNLLSTASAAASGQVEKARGEIAGEVNSARGELTPAVSSMADRAAVKVLAV